MFSELFVSYDISFLNLSACCNIPARLLLPINPKWSHVLIPPTFCPVKVPIEQIQMWTSLRSPFSLSLPPAGAPTPPSPNRQAMCVSISFFGEKISNGGRETFHQCWQESTFGSLCRSVSSGWWNSQLSINNCVYTVYTLSTHTCACTHTHTDTQRIFKLPSFALAHPWLLS